MLCSTGAIITRYNGRNPLLLPMLAPAIECNGFEFMMYPGWYSEIDTIATAMSTSGLCFPVIHADKQIGELISRNAPGDIDEVRRRFKLNCMMAGKIGSRLMVLHLWGGEPSDNNFDFNMDMYAELAETAAAHGLTLTIENVVCGKSSPLLRLNELLNKFPDMLFTIDTKMAEFHGELSDTLACKRLWEGHVRHLHVNDYGGGVRDFSNLRVLHIGEGHVDFESFFAHIKKKDYSGFATVESSSVRIDGSIDVGRLNRSIERVRAGLCR